MRLLIILLLLVSGPNRSYAGSDSTRYSFKLNAHYNFRPYKEPDFFWYDSEIDNNSLYFRPALLVHKKNGDFWEFEFNDLKIKNATNFESSSYNVDTLRKKSRKFKVLFKSTYNVNLLKKSKSFLLSAGLQNSMGFTNSLTETQNISKGDGLISHQIKRTYITAYFGFLFQGGYHLNDSFSLGFSMPLDIFKIYTGPVKRINSMTGTNRRFWDFSNEFNRRYVNEIIVSISYRIK